MLSSGKIFEFGNMSYFSKTRTLILRVKHDFHYRQESIGQSLSEGARSMASEMFINGMSPSLIVSQITKSINIQLSTRSYIISGLLSCPRYSRNMKIQEYLIRCISENVSICTNLDSRVIHLLFCFQQKWGKI